MDSMISVQRRMSINMADNHQQYDSDVRRTGSSSIVVRRGVASVLAMMFLMLFSSLAAVMAILAQGNVQTALVPSNLQGIEPRPRAGWPSPPGV